LLAAPAWATVQITLTDRGEGVIEIGYDASGETELVRAFALDIVATDGNIIDINDYIPGDDNGGYGIFPGSFDGNIDVNPTTGDVDSWVGNPNPYTPVAPAGDTDALGDIPGPAITVEMGSLYTTAGPGTTGVLCTITVDGDVTKVCVKGNAIRGNVVLEDASEATTNLAVEPEGVCIEIGECFPKAAPFTAQYNQWAALGKPECWCPDYGAVGAKNNQCYGDGAGDMHTRGYVVYTTDLNRMAASWKAAIGAPNLDPCSDFAHDSHTRGYVVYTTDLNILAANWKKAPGPAPGGVPGDCPVVPLP
jgi:hypothetical protein